MLRSTVNLVKTIEKFAKTIKTKDVDPKTIPLQLFPYFVIRNCMMGTHMICGIESIGKALLQRNEVIDEIDNLLLESRPAQTSWLIASPHIPTKDFASSDCCELSLAGWCWEL